MISVSVCSSGEAVFPFLDFVVCRIPGHETPTKAHEKFTTVARPLYRTGRALAPSPLFFGVFRPQGEFL